MDKVYVVTSGCYSDYQIEAVFSSKEKAELYVAVHYDYDYNIKNNNDYVNIEEYTISDSLIKGTVYYGLLFYVSKEKINKPYWFSPLASTSPIAEEIKDFSNIKKKILLKL